VTTYGLQKFKARTSANVQWIMNWQTLPHMDRAEATWALTRWQHFSVWNDVMARHLEVRRQVKNPTLSIDALAE